MQVNNDDIARILGRIEGKLDVQAESTKRLEGSLASLDVKVTQRLDYHEQRLRELEIANPKATAERVGEHEKRIQALENGAARSGAVAGIGASVAVAALIELLKRKLGM